MHVESSSTTAQIPSPGDVEAVRSPKGNSKGYFAARKVSWLLPKGWKTALSERG
ncbi:hypothetical protein SXIM_00220 [Streptomyces xiamenensis]|uniref:Uncharacterized protein n=1 Tax=Streptomyces xiamenensis TaxID=408015 RepID=A0A0F7CMM2_9ACTN|nr:hypothetical protein SXIM_00220 [Streptomyces xiamenensis]